MDTLKLELHSRSWGSSGLKINEIAIEKSKGIEISIEIRYYKKNDEQIYKHHHKYKYKIYKIHIHIIYYLKPTEVFKEK
jgi:hypothetical protein